SSRRDRPRVRPGRARTVVAGTTPRGRPADTTLGHGHVRIDRAAGNRGPGPVRDPPADRARVGARQLGLAHLGVGALDRMRRRATTATYDRLPPAKRRFQGPGVRLKVPV